MAWVSREAGEIESQSQHKEVPCWSELPNPHFLTGSSTLQFTWLSHTQGWAMGPGLTVTLRREVWGGVVILNGKCDAPSFQGCKTPTDHWEAPDKGTGPHYRSLTASKKTLLLIWMARQEYSWLLYSGDLPVWWANRDLRQWLIFKVLTFSFFCFYCPVNYKNLFLLPSVIIALSNENWTHLF